MNQDSFRRLIDAPRLSTSSSALGAASTSRSRLVVQSKPKNTTEVVSKPAFKPRNIKKAEDAKNHDKISQDKSTNLNANNNVNLEPSPSRGLDLALLQQEREKAGLLSTNDVDELEQAFAESSSVQHSEHAAPTKRTRDDLIRELKQKRLGDAGQSSESIKADLQLEEAKQKGKFKPIGFTSTSKRRKDGTGAVEGKKKKRKVDDDKKDPGSQVRPLEASNTDTSSAKPTSEPPKPTADEHFDDDFDIFAGAGEYTGVDIDDHKEPEIPPSQPTEESHSVPQRWIAMDEREQASQATTSRLPIPIPENAKEADQEVEEQPSRLAPLESSAVPSIKELLDMHAAADKYEKKLKRKEKKQKKRGGNGKGSDNDDE